MNAASLTVPHLTVAIPAYNRGRALIPLLRNLADQARPSDELLVVDDGSTDDTAAAVAEVPRFELRRNPVNLGMVGNWNTCLNAAQHDWICLVHHDDEPAPGALATLRAACARADGPALIAHWREDAAIDEHPRYRWCEPGPWAVLHTPTIPSGAVVHRAIVETLGGFDPRWEYSADLEYFPRICARYPLLVIESPDVIRYRLHRDNHQYWTWRQPDFYPRLLALQEVIVGYAGLTGEAARATVEKRMAGMDFHMFMSSRMLGDRALLRRTGARFGARRGFPWRLRLLALGARLSGWAPRPRTWHLADRGLPSNS